MALDLQLLQARLETLLAAYPEQSWALAHARRLARLAERIAEGMEYDRAVLLCAAYLHDLGAFAAHGGAGGEHPRRSRQVVESEILPHLRGSIPLNSSQEQNLLNCIELHDYRDPRPAPSVEALLLHEVDALDLLGAVGLAREYLAGPNDLERVNNRIRARMRDLRPIFLLPAAQRLAAQRLAEMEAFLAALEDELRA